ncbi:MAG: hypothetical protein AMXMBFR84_32330 [Candidatus Hydrogenedentota bacterium]
MTKSQMASTPTRRAFVSRLGAVAAGSIAMMRTTKTFGQTPTGANDRIGVGIIGCGGRGRHHAGELEKMRANGAPIAITAVCDVYRPRMEAAALQCNANRYMDHRELLSDSNVDVVCIATPDHIHGPQVIDAVLAGKDVYCEKPFTHWRQFDVTKAVVDAVKSSGRVFQVGTQGMSDSAWHQMRALVDQGLIGTPIQAECGYFRVGDWGERGMPIDDPAAVAGPDLNWEAFLGDAPKRDFDVSRFFRWRMYEDYSGGPVTDLFPHSLTPVVHALSLGTPELAVATGGKFRYEEREVPDTFNMLIDYNRLTVAVLGTQGNNCQGAHGRGAGGRCPTLRGWEGTLTVERVGDTAEDEIVFRPAEGSKKELQRFPIDHRESVQAHWQNLLDCVRTRQQPHGGIDLAFHVQVALQMAALAHRGDKTVRFNAATQSIAT